MDEKLLLHELKELNTHMKKIAALSDVMQNMFISLAPHFVDLIAAAVEKERRVTNDDSK